jgi:dethiobiotin synthetase
MKGVFVTGTDTGVGKTYASLGLIAGWKGMGLKVGVMKPSETDCLEEGPRDAKMLLEAAGSDQPLSEVCPYQYDEPLAPAEAAAKEGKGEVSFEKAAEVYRAVSARHDITLVEGAGGLLVPFAGRKTAADLALLLGLPLIVVARIGLGTINHTWLTVEAARSRNIPVLGVIFSRACDPESNPIGPDEERNPDAVGRLARVKVIADLPFRPEGSGRIELPLA